MAFEAYGEQLQTVPRFKYLGMILAEDLSSCSHLVGFQHILAEH